MCVYCTYVCVYVGVWVCVCACIRARACVCVCVLPLVDMQLCELPLANTYTYMSHLCFGAFFSVLSVASCGSWNFCPFEGFYLTVNGLEFALVVLACFVNYG